MGVKETKYNRRRAINCKLIEKSKNNPNYYKYLITIGDKNGTISKEPAYGKDMQDALSRLLQKERLVKVEKKLDGGQGAGWVFIAWLIMMGIPAYFMELHGSPLYMLFGFVGMGVIVGLAMWYWNYINKK